MIYLMDRSRSTASESKKAAVELAGESELAGGEAAALYAAREDEERGSWCLGGGGGVAFLHFIFLGGGAEVAPGASGCWLIFSREGER